MKVLNLGYINSGTEDINELYNYLSLIVLSKKDKQVEEQKIKYDSDKTSISEMKRKLSKLAIEYSSNRKESSRLSLIGRILSLVNTLRREGVLIGKRKSEIIKVLNEIETKPISILRDLEEKLVVYLPEKMN